ncbi:MAG TPA: TraR/DksA family transcriptional regulator [Bryobacteraceae bacterium]|nr:TraR/DksA family transcriptional regulator [Bryobacteraceae bacterium]
MRLEIDCEPGGDEVEALLTEDQRLHIRNALEARRRELIDGIRSQAVELAVSDGIHDPIDKVQMMAYRDEAVQQVGRLSETLSSVEKSLAALSGGYYGHCAECGKPIAAKRLEVIPWASHCLNCQARRESNHHAGAGPSGDEREAAA